MLSMTDSCVRQVMPEREIDTHSQGTVWRKGNPGKGDRLSKDKGSRKLSEWQGTSVSGEPRLFMRSPGSKRLRSRLDQVGRVWNSSKELWQIPKAVEDMRGLRVT